MSELIIVGCAKTKLPGLWPARTLYTSPLFKYRRAYAERAGGKWCILSAKYGLVWPRTLLVSYDVTLKDLDAEEKEQLRLLVRGALHTMFKQSLWARSPEIEVHAGRDYVDIVQRALFDFAPRITTPTAGLSIGQTLAFYKSQGLSI